MPAKRALIMVLKVIKKQSRQTELLLEAAEAIRRAEREERSHQRAEEQRKRDEYWKWINTHKNDHRPKQYRMGKSPGSYR